MAIDSTVKLFYKVDTSEAKKKIRELSGEQKKQAKEALDGLEAQNSALDNQLKQLAKWGVAIGAAAAAWAALDAGFETYEKNSRLRAANVNTNLQGLQKATRGLVDDTRLLEFSAKAMNGTFALTQEQTELVLQGALALRKTMGVDLAEAMERVQQAVNEANGEALKPLGITIKETTGTAEAQQAIIRALSDEYGKLGGNVELATDNVTRARTDFANSVDSIKENLGKIAVALAPIVSALAKIVSLADRALGLGDGLSVTDGLDLERYGYREGQTLLGQLQGRGMAKEDAKALVDFLAGRTGRGQGAAFNRLLSGAGATGLGAGVGGGGGTGGYSINGEELEGRVVRPDVTQLRGAGIAGGGAIPSVTPNRFSMGVAGLTDEQRAAGLKNLQNIQAQLIEQTIRGSAAFQSFETVVVSAFSNMASGAMSWTEALRKALGAQVIDLGQVALKKAAYAFAEGFLGNPRGFAAGAAYTAAGVGLIALGSKMSGGGGGAAASASPSTIGIGAGGGGGPRNTTTVNLIGEDFGEMSPRARVAYARRQARRAGITFEGDVVERV